MTGLKDIDSVSHLITFLNGLGYKVKAEPLYIPDFGFPDSVKKILGELYLLSDYEKRFQIYLAKIPALTRTNYRNIIESFNSRFPQINTLFIFTKDWEEIVFINPERIALGVGKPKLKLKTLVVDREHIYHTDQEVIENIRITPHEQTPDIIYEKHKNAFNVERVTKEFFNAYKFALESIKDILSYQEKATPQEVHSFAQQLLSRIMFLYFVQKKGWLKWKDYVQDKRYIKNLWERYKGYKTKGSNFYSQWLSKLFFNAFQGPNKHADIHKDPYLPKDIKESFVIMPFLNGGLFIENRLDKIGFQLPDEIFQHLFDLDPFDSKKGFLERFNFTIREDTTLEVEVAVDPEMLGKVYESLISEEERGKAGIFYTPRVEIDFMCKLSLIEYLTEETGLSKVELIPLVFEPQTILPSSVIPAPPSVIPAKAGIHEGFSSDDIRKVMIALHKVRIVDPAVGSASFLVGMMNVLVELYKYLYQMAERKKLEEINLFGLKKQIISENLYGVDVKDWAVMVGELRLWLSLIIETEEKYFDIYSKALLPSFTFKMRQGDSLVEEVAGKQLFLRGEYGHIPETLRHRIEEIKGKKTAYFNDSRHEWEKEIEEMEHALLKDILSDDIKKIDKRVKARKNELESRPKEQMGLLKTKEEREEASRKKTKELEADIEKLEVEKKRLQEILMGAGKKKDYFLWEIDFAEVFAEKGGFDIVLGNPPYVRQEQIAFPLEREEDFDADEWRERKREYKDKLVNSAKLLWGDTLKIDKKSDLYVYFYYHGLALLKPKGTFCFINSNSWLDVGYGVGLQEFLLKRMEPMYVIDNIAKRSFEADVNTVIVLIKRPSTNDVINHPISPLKKEGKGGFERKQSPLKFIAFKKPFEEVVKPETILEIEQTNERTVTDDYRISPKDMEELLLEGIEIHEEEEKRLIEKDPMHLPYSGNKWGGKYLRAPDIFFTILEKGKGKLVRLGDIAEVRFGIKTGANEFFYLTPLTSPLIKEGQKGVLKVRNEAGWEGEIEEEFLKPVIKSPRECKTILINPKDLKYKVFMCHKDKKGLKGTNALKYIEWGEKQGFHKRPTCRGRQRWWDLGENNAPIIVRSTFNDKFDFFFNPKRFLLDKVMYGIFARGNAELISMLLNTTFIAMFIEIYGTYGLGEGALFVAVYNFDNIPIISPIAISPMQREMLSKVSEKLLTRETLNIYEELGINPSLPIREQKPNPLPDRKALDDIVFDILGLTEDERNEVYWAVCELVKNRLEKARSV
ncbi:MAG: Eco57I restriction-modification methylase domain-containing protein [Nitrospirae bacterium]|nr:Eco57I restriction-modification methylase domain-containing protein [Nitrospirota bacterium]